nr:hypothetical protein [Alphaproteobacteria bacterium]
YAIWFSQVVRAAFYPDSANKDILEPVMVDEIAEIVEKLRNDMVIDRLKTIQLTLHGIANKIIESPDIPSIKDFDSFWQTYEGFSVQLQRLEKDALLSDFGVDVASGLRSSTVMVSELERELERRSRRGQPFSMAVLRIDNVELRADEKALEAVSAAILKTIRNFDDAYVSGNGEYVVSLKHSDTTGGLRFVARFNHALKDDLGMKFTVSSCVAEPLPGDDVPTLLANVRADLDQLCGLGKGESGQYEEVSPLNRFLQSLDHQEKEA